MDTLNFLSHPSIMSNQNPAFPALVSLALTPSLHYEEFCTGLHEIASTLCTQHYPRGLLTNYVTHTPNQFNALGLTIPDPDPNAAPEATLPAPYPTLPVKPTHPVGQAATNATLSLFRLQDTLYIDVTQGITAIRAHALAFLGETITTELRGLPGGLTAQGLPEILAYLEHEYGTPTEYDLRTLVHRQIDQGKYSPIFPKYSPGEYLGNIGEYLKDGTSCSPRMHQ